MRIYGHMYVIFLKTSTSFDGPAVWPPFIWSPCNYISYNIWIKWEVVINRISWGWFTLTLIPFCAGIEIQTCPTVPSRLFERAQWKHRSLLLLVLLIKCCYLHIYTPILDSQSFPSKKQCSRTVQQKKQVQLLAKWSSKEVNFIYFFPLHNFIFVESVQKLISDK